MKNKLMSRINFAKLCKVTPTSITRACKTSLAPATVGVRIDVNHVNAIDYRLRQESAKTIGAPDVLYDKVARWCKDHNRYSVRGIVSSGIVGRVRAERILAELTSDGSQRPRADSAETVAPDVEGLQSEGSTQEIAPDGEPRPPTPDPAPDKKPSGWTARNEDKKKAETATLDVPDHISAFADFTLREIIKRFGSDAMFLDFLKALKEIESINEKRLKNAQTEGVLVSRELVQIGVIDVVDSAMRKLLTAGTKKIARMAHSMTLAGEPIDAIETEVKDQVGQYVKNIKVKSARTLRG